MRIPITWIIFWLAIWVLESYYEFAWIQSSFEGKSAFEVFGIAALAEGLLMLVRVPTAHFISQAFIRLQSGIIRQLMIIAASLFAGIVAFRLIIIFPILNWVYADSPETDPFFSTTGLASASVNLIFVTGLFVAYRQYQYVKEQQQRAQKLQEEKLQTELKFIRAQLNPHFLFNTLNNIYALAIKKSDQSPKAILQLSELLRFMLYDASSQILNLNKELTALRLYLELQAMRYDHSLKLITKFEVEDSNFNISPLIILHLAENAFKHGAGEALDSAWIEISVVQQNGTCKIKIANSKNLHQTTNNNNQNFGLRTIQKQLELAYQKHFELLIENLDERFSISLVLKKSL